MDISEIRRRLRRRFKDRDGSGYEYEARFPSEVHRFYEPHVLVRVELRRTEEQNLYQFQVRVDYQCGNGTAVDEAGRIKEYAAKAYRKAVWAENLVQGKTWTMDEIWTMDETRLQRKRR